MVMKIGVLGTGQISSALVKGFCSDRVSAEKLHFYLSPRNAENAARLAEMYPAQVTVCDSNQEVLDLADDWVILALIPHDAEAIIRPLSFNPAQKLLTLISDHPVERIREWTGVTSKIIRMVPLPFAALHIGPIAYYPADREIRDLFGPLGQLVELDGEERLNSILTLTSLMSPFYLLIHHTVEWGKEHGLSDHAALDYMSSFFEALSVMAGKADDSQAVATLCYDTTKGGLNEYVYTYLTKAGCYEQWTEALDHIKARLDQANPNAGE